MKTTTFAILGVLFLGTTAYAHGDHGGFGGFGGFGIGGLGGLGIGDFGFGHHHDGEFDGFGGGFGLGLANNADVIQMHFVTRFDDLQTQYDDGVANTTDFFTSTTYDSIVNKSQRLTDRYDFFLNGVQNGIDRIDNLITMTNDDISFYNDLLANYQSDTSISATKLDRIELWINHITDRLNTRIDTLTTQQTTLETNLPTYQSFQTDLTTFLSDIQSAGGGSPGTSSSSVEALLSPVASLSALSGSGSLSESASLALSSSAVPEPSMAVLLLLGGAGLPLISRRRR